VTCVYWVQFHMLCICDWFIADQIEQPSCSSLIMANQIDWMVRIRWICPECHSRHWQLKSIQNWIRRRKTLHLQACDIVYCERVENDELVHKQHMLVQGAISFGDPVQYSTRPMSVKVTVPRRFKTHHVFQQAEMQLEHFIEDIVD